MTIEEVSSQTTEKDKIVISGIAASFPEAVNVQEFTDKLLLGQNLLKNTTSGIGKLKYVNKFDAQFFDVNNGNALDPASRMLLEKTYEAIVDSGTNISTIKGQNCGVFVTSNIHQRSENDVILPSRTLVSNKISQWLGIHGPSLTITSCPSTLQLLELAFESIWNGKCDSAIVGACNFYQDEPSDLELLKSEIVNPDKTSKPFDDYANGIVKSESVGVLYLQLASEAKRIYAEIVSVGSNYSADEQEKAQVELLHSVYKTAGVNVNDIQWIEAYGSAIKMYDEQEINVLAKVFKSKQSPIFISSVKSNVGNAESASEIASIVKVIVAMENDFIPETINVSRPRTDVEAINSERVKVITEKLPWDGGLVGINSFNFGGNNYHCLLKSGMKSRKSTLKSLTFPYAIGVTGRTSEAVDALLSAVETDKPDVDYIYLLNELHKQNISKQPYRGFRMIAQGSESVKFIEKLNVEDKSLWYLFPDSNVVENVLSSKLLELDYIKDTVYKCHAALKYKGLDLLKILRENPDSDPFDQYMRNTVLQFIVVDFLSSLNIKPDGYIGFSMGEIACAYMDGHVTIEEAVLLAYYFGYFIFRTQKVYREKIGSAVVGVQYDEVKTKISSSLRCQPHKNVYFSFITGPLAILETFIERYNYKCVTKIYKERYLPVNNHVILEFIDILNQVIRFEKPRTKKWVSASISEKNSVCSAEYFAKALLATSDQVQPLSFVPQNAVILVIGSDDAPEILQMLTNVEYYPLFQKSKPVDIESLLAAVGRAYVNGVKVDFGALYPPIQRPVRKGTKMISPFVRWDHQVDYNVPTTLSTEQHNERIVRISLNDHKMKFIAGHGIDVAVFYPGMGYLVLVWETLALIHSKLYTEFPVVFENVRFSRATIIRTDAETVFHIAIHKISGYFELTENDQLVSSGYVYNPKSIKNIKYKSIISDGNPTAINNNILLTTDDLYKEFYLRGYNYKGIFQSLIDADMMGINGRIRWADNWVPFLDCMLQSQLLTITSGALVVPTSIEKVIIDVDKHKSVICEKNSEIPVCTDRSLVITEAGGVQIKDARYKPIPRKPFNKQPVLLKYKFIPFILADNISQQLVATIFAEILMEYVQTKFVNIAEIVQHKEQINTLLPSLLTAINSVPIFDTEYTVQIDETEFISPVDYNDDICMAKPYYDKRFHLIVLSEIVDKTEVLQAASKYLVPNGFLALKQNADEIINIPDDFIVCCDYVSDGYRILLLHKENEQKSYLSALIKVSSQNYSWIGALQNVLKTTEKTKIFLLSENEPDCGILGFYNCLRMERGAENVRCVSVVDTTAPKFSLQDNFYKSQLSKNLSVNIYKEGKWGRYVRLSLDALSTIQVPHAFVGLHKVDNKYKLDWFQSPINNDESNETIIYSYYSSINTTDVLLLTGRIAIESIVDSAFDKDYVLGREFAGYGKDGKRYIGICNNGALSTVIKCADELLVEVPNDWNLEDAATVPFAYFIVLYALTVLSEIKINDIILIHQGATIISQAAINIANFYKCEIFVSVANSTEKTIITSNFQNIPEDHILNSNDDTFEQFIVAKTNGRGVQFAFSSFNEDKIIPIINCLSVNGHFIQTKKIDLNKGHAINSNIFSKNISFHSAVFEDLIDLPAEKKIKLKTSFEKHLSIGAIKPLEHISFAAKNLDSALKHAVVSKNTKKILIKTWSSDAFDNKNVMDAIPRFVCSNSKTYVVCGGLGGIGLQLINWLIVRGARKILITSRSGVTTGYQRMQIARWKSYGVHIVVSTADISNPEGTQALLNEANALGSVVAIFNLAAVLQDKVFKNQTEEFFKVSAEGKAVGTHNLDKYSRTSCSELEYFVVFSSISCGYGNIGQTNYGMSNSTAERICEKRKQDNLPALAVQWGAVGDVGMAITLLGDKTNVDIGGTSLQPITSCLEALEQFLLQKTGTVVTSFIMANKNSINK